MAQTENKELKGIFDQRAGDGERHNLSIFLFGTSMLRSWQEDLEKDYGTRPLELMEAIGEWCTRALNGDTTCLSPNVAVTVAFEVITGDHEARCEARACMDGSCACMWMSHVMLDRCSPASLNHRCKVRTG